MRKSWILGALVGTIAVATVGGVALAQTATSTPTASPVPPSATATPQTFSSRLAKELGISEDKLNAAIIKVRRQEQDDRVSAMLTKAVAAGKITQAQADQFLTWWKSRPDAPLLPPGGRGRFGHFMLPGKPGANFAPPAKGSGFLPPPGPNGRFGLDGPGFQAMPDVRGFGGRPGNGLMPPWAMPPTAPGSPPVAGTSA